MNVNQTVDTKYFQTIVDMVCEKSPLQEKKLRKYLAGCDANFFADAENFAEHYTKYLDSQEIPLEYAVKAYLKMGHDMLKLQIDFMKTKEYHIDSAAKANEEVYSSKPTMKSYMIGLAISQFLWPTHYAMYRFLRDAINARAPRIKSYLEIGPGHGLFLDNAMKTLPSDATFSAVDISPISMKITKSIMDYFHPGKDIVRYYNMDMLDLDLEDKFDFITMGEVIEHVEYPERLLTKLRDLLTPDGRAFISTCVDCPALDHVYHFRSVDQIRQMIAACGLDIETEAVLPVEDLPLDEIVRRKITINYCAILKRRDL